LDKVYRETSLRVLDLLKNKYRLFEHLQSLRRYLLLGQGDFIRHLLELLVYVTFIKCRFLLYWLLLDPN
jgi:gamma-tubulin complex component 3